MSAVFKITNIRKSHLSERSHVDDLNTPLIDDVSDDDDVERESGQKHGEGFSRYGSIEEASTTTNF